MSKTINFKPIHDRVLVRLDSSEEKTPGGIIIPEQAKEKPVTGDVLSVGTGRVLDSGEVRPLAVSVGDKVIFGKYAGTEVKIDGEMLLIMRESDLFGVVG